MEQSRVAAVLVARRPPSATVRHRAMVITGRTRGRACDCSLPRHATGRTTSRGLRLVATAPCDWSHHGPWPATGRHGTALPVAGSASRAAGRSRLTMIPVANRPSCAAGRSKAYAHRPACAAGRSRAYPTGLPVAEPSGATGIATAGPHQSASRPQGLRVRPVVLRVISTV